MEKSEVARLVGELKGAPSSVVLALVLLGRPLSVGDLSTMTRYSAPTLRTALDRLALLGFIQEEKSCGQYVLTVYARQFILGETGNVLVDSEAVAEKEKNFFTLHVHDSEALLNPKIETSLSHVEGEKIFCEFDDDAEEAVRALMELGRLERTKNGKGARDAVEAALAGGWTGLDCLEEVINYRRYARTEKGKWIDDVGGYAAYALRMLRECPAYTLKYEDPEYWDWFQETSPYADIIKH